MVLVVADTGPINYLVLVGHVDLLPALFERVFIPAEVRRELTADGTPPAVRSWVEACPAWLDVRDAEQVEQALAFLDPGEKAAIELAVSINADLVLMDDRKGVRAAHGKGFQVTGTLGVLDRAADAGLVNFADAVRKLERTNFRRPERILEALLRKHARQPSTRHSAPDAETH